MLNRLPHAMWWCCTFLLSVLSACTSTSYSFLGLPQPSLPLGIEASFLHSQGDIAKLREVYDSFFAEYPLCFGYWKKYADAELRHTSVEAAAAVYERGVAAVPYSVDLWGHYAAFKQANGASPDAVDRYSNSALQNCMWTLFIAIFCRHHACKLL